MADLVSDETREFVIRDSADHTKELKVNTDGSINVAGINEDIPSTASINYFVTNGKVFTFGMNLNMPSAGTNNPLLLLKNPSGSGKTIYIYKVSTGINVANVNACFKLFHTPTITSNGTSKTPVNSSIGHSTASSAELYSVPTISASGTEMKTWSVGQNGNSIDFLGDFEIRLPANTNLLLTGDPSSNNRESSLTLCWAEV